MDDMKVIMQDELRQALAGLMPPPAPAAAMLLAAVAHATAIPPATVALIANPLVVDASLANNDNTGGQPLNAARNVPAVEMKFEDVENYMVEKAKK